MVIDTKSPLSWSNFHTSKVHLFFGVAFIDSHFLCDSTFIYMSSYLISKYFNQDLDFVFGRTDKETSEFGFHLSNESIK